MQLKCVHLIGYFCAVEMRASDWLLPIVVLRCLSYNPPATAFLLIGLFQLVAFQIKVVSSLRLYHFISPSKRRPQPCSPVQAVPLLLLLGDSSVGINVHTRDLLAAAVQWRSAVLPNWGAMHRLISRTQPLKLVWVMLLSGGELWPLLKSDSELSSPYRNINDAH